MKRAATFFCTSSFLWVDYYNLLKNCHRILLFALAAANRVLMFEHAVYSVISPEGCASILWRTSDKAADAAEAMKITANDLQALGVVDRIVDEPTGGAHRDPPAAIDALKAALVEEIDGLQTLGGDELLAQRRTKFLAIG